MIPVLIDHDHSKPIGTVTLEGGKLLVRLKQGMTKAQFFDTFGNVGGGLLKMEQHAGELFDWDTVIFTEFEIQEFSFDPRAGALGGA